MSIFISDFSNPTSWTVVHDDAHGGAHTGTIAPADVTHPKNMDGSENHLMLVVECPVCQSVSTHPVGGGAQPPLVQEMFTRKVQSEGCPCGSVDAGRDDDVPEAHVRLQVSRMDGPQRWQFEGVQTQARMSKEDLQAEQQAAPGTVKIVYRDDDGLIIGEKPKGGVGSDHKLAHISEAEYAKLLSMAPAYLAPDKQTVVSTPQ